MKRKPIDPRMEQIGNRAHIAFDTVPWNTVEEAEEARAAFAGFRRQRCLKTLDDWQFWEDFSAGAIKRRRHRAKGGAGIHRTKEGEIGIMRRTFLRAYTKQVWGITRTFSYPELSVWLTENGYPTTATEVKNAARAKLVENVVPVTDPVKQLLTLLRTEFPDLDVAKFVGQADVALLVSTPV